MRNDLLSLYLKYDTNFNTISKIALGELIVKIVYFAKKEMSIKYISKNLQDITESNIPENNIVEAIKGLNGKIINKGNKYYIAPSFIPILNSAKSDSENLHKNILKKFFSKTSNNEEDILAWFQSTTISFFEKYNFEWFHIVTKKKKKTEEIFTLDPILESSFCNYNFSNKDKEWLAKQYKKFVFESDADADNLFWQYGLSAFSSRLISASTYANKINIDCFKGMTFLLDTNVLMILGLEKHKLNHSISILEKCFDSLGVKLEYLYITQEEYRRAIEAKKNEVGNVFDEYNEDVLQKSECPFIKTALARHCKNKYDVDIMFKDIESVPNKFSSIIDISILDNKNIADVVEKSQTNEMLKNRINDVYFKYKNRNKRELALLHDSGLIGAGRYLREHTGNYTILTNDNILKIYSSQNLQRDDISLAIGLDVIIGLLTVGGENIHHDSSKFAPLFKNIIKSSLIPSKDVFQVEDLAFMLAAHLEINKLDSDKIVEIAQKVNQKITAGEEPEKINLYLRREIEGYRLNSNSEIKNLKEEKEIVTQQRNDAIFEKQNIISNLKEEEKIKIKKRRKLLRIFWIILFIIIALLFGLIIYWTFEDKKPYNIIAAVALPIIIMLIEQFPYKKIIAKKYADNDEDIEKEVERHIEKLLKNNKKY